MLTSFCFSKFSKNSREIFKIFHFEKIYFHSREFKLARDNPWVKVTPYHGKNFYTFFKFWQEFREIFFKFCDKIEFNYDLCLFWGAFIYYVTLIEEFLYWFKNFIQNLDSKLNFHKFCRWDSCDIICGLLLSHFSIYEYAITIDFIHPHFR